MVNTTCPSCGGYYDSMVQEMCNTCLAEKLAILRADNEAKDAEIRTWEEKTMAQQCRANAAEARVKELEDLLKRSNKAARLEDLERIAALERERDEAVNRLTDARDKQFRFEGKASKLERELAEAKKDRAGGEG